MQEGFLTILLALLLLLSWGVGVVLGIRLLRQNRLYRKAHAMLKSRPRDHQTAMQRVPDAEVMHGDHFGQSEQLPEEQPQAAGFSDTAVLDSVPLKTPKAILKPPVGIATNLLLVASEPDPELKHFLGHPFQVTEVSGGKEAIASLEEVRQATQAPVMIICDAHLSDMSAFQLHQKLKNSEQHCSLPFILLASREMALEEFRTLRLGIDDYLMYPLKEEAFMKRILALVKRQGKRGRLILNETGSFRKLHFTMEDMAWLSLCETHLLEHIGEFDLNAERLADSLALSRTLLFQRIKYLTGLTLNQYTREVRLQEARRMLIMQPSASVKSIALSVGFRDVKYFSQQFQKAYGKIPSKYAV